MNKNTTGTGSEGYRPSAILSFTFDIVFNYCM